MLALQAASRIGFGCYRVNAGSPDHAAALESALSYGCNLIDTAASYMGGSSEVLVGRVLASLPEFETFVITKGGYLPTRIPDTLVTEPDQAFAAVTLADGTHYSLRPDALADAIEGSCSRLRTAKLDAFLLHNPEEYWASTSGSITDQEMGSLIREAFGVLEECVARGRIRYYGVSSNVLPDQTIRSGPLGFRALLDAAHDISPDHNFRIVEFPFNFCEQTAIRPGADGLSLLDLTREQGIVTVGNRPLNAITNTGPLRLATYETTASVPDPAAAFETCIDRLDRKLRQRGFDDSARDFPIVTFLRDQWMSLRTPEAAETILSKHFFPLVNRIYDGPPAGHDAQAYSMFADAVKSFARAAMTQRANEFREELIRDGRVSISDRRPLARIACEAYLQAGLDHVLVGMRSTSYVEALSPLLDRRRLLTAVS
jgi:aryl-alcohol dehydrogenase-like predicted oxidoreductase